MLFLCACSGFAACDGEHPSAPDDGTTSGRASTEGGMGSNAGGSFGAGGGLQPGSGSNSGGHMNQAGAGAAAVAGEAGQGATAGASAEGGTHPGSGGVPNEGGANQEGGASNAAGTADNTMGGRGSSGSGDEGGTNAGATNAGAGGNAPDPVDGCATVIDVVLDDQPWTNCLGALATSPCSKESRSYFTFALEPNRILYMAIDDSVGTHVLQPTYTGYQSSTWFCEGCLGVTYPPNIAHGLPHYVSESGTVEILRDSDPGAGVLHFTLTNVILREWTWLFLEPVESWPSDWQTTGLEYVPSSRCLRLPSRSFFTTRVPR